MSSPIAEEHSPAGLTPAVQWILVANIAIYFLQQTVVRPDDMVGMFAFTSQNVVLRWWTPLTYAFVHGDIWHILFNMIALWQFGPRVERLFGTSRFVRFYALCAFGGAALHAAAVHWFGIGGGALIGASASVIGVMYAFAHAWPRTMLLFFGVIPMQVRWYIAAFTGLTLFWAYTGTNGGVAHFAHIGGLFTAWMLVRLPSARKLGTWPDRFNQVPELPEDETPRAVPRSAMRPPRGEAADAADDVVARSNALVQRRPPSVAPQRPAVTAIVAPTQTASEELNMLLDKMSSGGGRDSLTVREQARLQELSDILRGQTR